MPGRTQPPGTDRGLAVLRARELELRDAIDAVVLSWAAEVGAVRTAYPALLRTSDLARLDYWVNFPHLALLAVGAAADREKELSAANHAAVDPGFLAPAEYALPSAACYSAYLDLSGTRLDGARKITTVATCFRRENRFEGLRRLLSFTMREVVCVGDRDTVLDHASSFKKRIGDFARRLGLPLEVQAATDPFFEKDAARTLMQQLFPVKEEFVFGGSLAIASVNFHRNFFGERCEIALADGSPAFTSCVAFGLERWLAALTERFGGEDVTLPERIREAAR
jgi:seryl-tRNA synthetase